MKVIAKYVTVEARLFGSRQGTRHETADFFHRFQGP